MIVVSDTTPITTLLKAGELALLEKLFGSVVIPGAVAEELLAFHEQLPSFISVRTVSEPDRLPPGVERLGKGETEAIQLAKEMGAEILITDDRRARTAAIGLGLKCTGLLGLLVHAKQRNLLSSVSAMIDVLEKKGGLYLSDIVRTEAMRIAGE
jgi:predicted nucleic acid-binding protein